MSSRRPRSIQVGAMVVLGAFGACGRLGFDPPFDVSGAHLDAIGAIDARDAPGDGVRASRCGSTPARLCDGYETALDPRWTLDRFNGDASRDPSRAYRGGASVHLQLAPVTTTRDNPRALIYTYDALPISGALHVRAWMYFAAPLTTSRFIQLINFADDLGKGIALGIQDGFVVANDYTSGSYLKSATTRIPVGRWTCVQFETPSGTTQSVREFVDGVEVSDVTIVRTTTQPPPTHVYLGLDLIGSVASYPAVEAWFDEVIIDDQPTTCDE